MELKPEDSSGNAARICCACRQQTSRNGIPKSQRQAISMRDERRAPEDLAHVLDQQLRAAHRRGWREQPPSRRPSLHHQVDGPARHHDDLDDGLCPPMRARTFSSASAAASIALASAPAGTRTTVTSLPLIWTGISISSSLASPGSLLGQGARSTAPSRPVLPTAPRQETARTAPAAEPACAAARCTTGAGISPAASCASACLQLVDKLHDRRDAGVEVPAAFEIKRDLGDGLMQLARASFVLGSAFAAAACSPVQCVTARAAHTSSPAAIRAPETGSRRRRHLPANPGRGRAERRTAHTCAWHRRRSAPPCRRAKPRCPSTSTSSRRL